MIQFLCEKRNVTRSDSSKSAVWPASWQFFSRCFIMLGLPLIGWGLADLAGFFSNPVRVAIAMIVLVLALAQAWMVYVTPPQPNEAKLKFVLPG